MADQAEQLRIKSMAVSNRNEAARKAKNNTRVIAVSSGKGGVGKTSLVLNISLALCRLGAKVVIIDADLGMANIDVLINAAPRYTLTDVVSGCKTLKEVMINGPLGVKIIPGSSGLFSMANLDGAKREILFAQLKNLEEEADYIIIDTAAGISRNVISFIMAADEFILVTTPEPTALTDAYGLLKVLFEQNGQQDINLVINLTQNIQQGQKAFNLLKKTAGQYLPGIELALLGEIRFDPVVRNAVHDYKPYIINKPQSSAAAATNRIAWRIASSGPGQGEEKGMAVFINRLKGLI